MSTLQPDINSELSTSYLSFNAQEWKNLRETLTTKITTDDLKSIIGSFEEPLNLTEINNIYVPITRLINLNFNAHFHRNLLVSNFLTKQLKVPFVIAISGSVASGKSTVSRLLKLLLENDLNLPVQLKVNLVNTDSFLYNLQYLEEHKLLDRKGFPESYDKQAIADFLIAIKAGKKAQCNIYSHLLYDIYPNKKITIEQPDILIIEGLNCLQNDTLTNNNLTFSDFIDFSIYVDAQTSLLEHWYIERFLKFYRSAFTDPQNYFYRLSKLNQQQAKDLAQQIWQSINLINLEQYIAPTKVKANLILKKGANHLIEQVHLRK